jgi:hypothetical protein
MGRLPSVFLIAFEPHGGAALFSYFFRHSINSKPASSTTAMGTATPTLIPAFAPFERPWFAALVLAEDGVAVGDVAKVEEGVGR